MEKRTLFKNAIHLAMIGLAPLMFAPMIGAASPANNHFPLRVLLKKLGTFNETTPEGAHALHIAAYLGELFYLQKLLSFPSVNINIRTRTNNDFDLGINLKNNKGGSTALMLAAFKGDYEMVKALLDQGSEVNAQDDRKQTALHYAILGHQEWPYKPLDAEHRKIIVLLLSYGADAHIEDEQGNNALYYYSLLAALTPGAGPHGYTSDPEIANNDRLYRQMQRTA